MKELCLVRYKSYKIGDLDLFMNTSFKSWLLASGKCGSTVDSICSRINRIKEEYLIEYEFERDQCASILDAFNYTSDDAKNGILPKVDISIKGDYIIGLRSLRRALILFVEYLKDGGQLTQNNSNTSAECIFEGSFSLFNRFTGPTWCKKVQQITKPLRKRASVCECCLQKRELDAAHKRHLDRLTIIKRILDDNYMISPDRYRVNLLEFEQKFVDAHKPFEDTFYFMCKSCHTKYDSDDSEESNKILESIIANKKEIKNDRI